MRNKLLAATAASMFFLFGLAGCARWADEPVDQHSEDVAFVIGVLENLSDWGRQQECMNFGKDPMFAYAYWRDADLRPIPMDAFAQAHDIVCG